MTVGQLTDAMDTGELTEWKALDLVRQQEAQHDAVHERAASQMRG